MKIQVLHAALALMLLSWAVLLPPAVAVSGYQIYYRVAGDPSPGSELALQLAMSKAGYDVRPMGSVKFNVTVEGEAKPIVLEADEAGVAEVRLKVPLSLIFGGALRIHVEAYSEFYAAGAERTIEIGIEPDYFGLACLAITSLSALMPLLVAASRRWKP